MELLTYVMLVALRNWVVGQVKTMDYECIVFDTAPTGHTLRLLQFPATLEKGLSKLMQLRGTFGGALSQIGTLLGANIDEMQGQLLGRLEELKVRCRHRPSCSADGTLSRLKACEFGGLWRMPLTGVQDHADTSRGHVQAAAPLSPGSLCSGTAVGWYASLRAYA